MAIRTTPTTRWIIQSNDPERAASLARSLDLTLPTAHALLNRGLDDPKTAQRFLDPRLEDFGDPGLLRDMAEAAERVLRAVRAGERIIVYGDYDADGVTATAILLRGLRGLGASPESFVPRRQVEGYGLSAQAIERLPSPALLIAVDCGVTALDEVAVARERGFDVIILDHHEPRSSLPPALAVVDPKRVDQPPITPFCAAGLAYQTVRAVHRLAGREEPLELLDLAAIGTIADVVPLVEDNRRLARHGLLRMTAGMTTTGVTALLRESGITGAVRARDVAFSLAPRLNAAGRLGDAAVAVTLLTTEDPAEAAEIAARLDAENRRRQELCEQVLAEAAAEVEEQGLAEGSALVLAREGWHPGVIGIVASALKERYGRPVVMIAVEEGVGRGSARSIEPLPMVEALAACEDVLLRYGGHAMAAGLTVAAEQIPDFRARFLAEAGRRLTPEDLVPAFAIDAEVELADLTLRFAEELGRLGPFGSGNPEPLFAVRGVSAVATRVVGAGHLRLGLSDGHAYAEAIGFSRGDVAELLAFTGARLDLACTVEVDRWGDQERVSLVVRDLLTPDLDLDAVLADGAVLVDRLFTRADEYLGSGFRGIEEAGAFYTKVAGVTFEGRQALLPEIQPGQTLALVREPTNLYDPHAVAVSLEDGRQVGYLQAALAARLAPSMDAGARYSATAAQLTGGGDLSYGLNIFLQREEPTRAPAPERWTARREEPPEALIERLRLHLQPGQRLRETQRAAIQGALAGGDLEVALGPGKRGGVTAVMAAAALAVARGGPAALVLPLASQVDAWHDLFEAPLRAAGLSVVRAHGALRLRQEQRLARALRSGTADILLASAEWARRNPEVKPVAAVLVGDADHPDTPAPVWEGSGQTGAPAPIVRFHGVPPAGGGEALIRDRYVRANLRLRDRRDAGEEAALRDEVPADEAKTLLFTPLRAGAVGLARALRDAHPRIAYYHGGLPARVRRVIAQLFLDGGITTLVATAAFAETVAPGDITRVIVHGLPFTRTQLCEIAALAGLDGRPATVVLAYRRDDVAAHTAWLEDRYPARPRLAALYRVLRDQTAHGPTLWPGERLASAIAPLGMPPYAVEAALDTLAQAGVLHREVVEGRWRIEHAAEEGRRDLAASPRYAEGERERAAFEAMVPWAFGPLSVILRALVGAADASSRSNSS